jgi:phosphatidylglycerophosphate synthase
MSLQWKELREKALFGLIDGLNGAVGLTIGLLHAHAASVLIFIALVARAGSSSVSMAGAQYQADDSAPNSITRWSRVGAMGLGYITSALLPGIGFAISTQMGLIVFVPMTLVVLSTIIWYKSASVGWLKSAYTTFIIFTLAVAVGLGASFIG